MARISKYLLKEEVLEKLFNLFFEIVGKKNNKEDFLKVINDLLSRNERIMLAKRLAVTYLLLKGISHQNICVALKVSSATVAKYSLLMDKSEGVVPSFKKILVGEKVSGFLEELWNELFAAPGVPGINWKASWERRRKIERKKQYGI